ncbi:unnamed protein product [Protopolystoma xenopodis]|uniref:non-specific serine/threonine protein kinase n=1 Tax=Protopolystoma xenopodis TaxID=117903 RepID=A0A3S5FD21_9PLAT|nr:unnamed protein product [Protopolystoma xenopodis]
MRQALEDMRVEDTGVVLKNLNDTNNPILKKRKIHQLAAGASAIREESSENSVV